MVGYGPWTFAWDGENRLVAVTSNGTLVVENQYDYMSRRVMKAIATQTNRFLYDGWNMIRETQVSGFSSQVSSFVWGLDLSGTLQGAGGVGGLLAVSINGTNAFPCFDANGNAMALVNEFGDTVASYDYSPFGECIQATGPMAQANPFRFSTKYTDDETGLVYYGYRFYNPELGRWLSRDPIGEMGGENLYVFLFNASVNFVEQLGLVVLMVRPSSAPEGIPYTYLPRLPEDAAGFLISRFSASCICGCQDDGRVGMHCIADLLFHILIKSTHRHAPEGTYGHEQQHVLSILSQVSAQIVPTLESYEHFRYPDMSACEGDAVRAARDASVRFGIMVAHENDDDPNPNPGRPAPGVPFRPIGPMPPNPSPPPEGSM